MCVTCLDGYPGPCEVGRSALRGREMLYPQPFAKVTPGSEKDYPMEFSHFNIQGSCVGATGVEADPDIATFPGVDVSTEIGEMIKKGKVPGDLAQYGTDVDHLFILAAKLKERYGRDSQRIPTGAIGMITYFDRLNADLQQIMAGARKFAVRYISRNDLVTLPHHAANISGIPYVMGADREEVGRILG